MEVPKDGGRQKKKREAGEVIWTQYRKWNGRGRSKSHEELVEQKLTYMCERRVDLEIKQRHLSGVSLGTRSGFLFPITTKQLCSFVS